MLPLATVDELIRTRPRLATEIGESLELERKLAGEMLRSIEAQRGALRQRGSISPR